MSLLNPKGKKGDKKANPKANNQSSKFFNNKLSSKGSGGGFVKKGMTGGSQRGS